MKNLSTRQLVLTGILGLGTGVAFGAFLGVEKIHHKIFVTIAASLVVYIFVYLLLMFTKSKD